MERVSGESCHQPEDHTTCVPREEHARWRGPQPFLFLGTQNPDHGLSLVGGSLPIPGRQISMVSQPPWPARPPLSQDTKEERRHELGRDAAASRRRHDAAPQPKVGEWTRERMQPIRMPQRVKQQRAGKALGAPPPLRPDSSSCSNAVLLAAASAAGCVLRGSEQPMRKAAVKRIIQGQARDSPITRRTPRPRYPYLALAGQARRAQPMEARDALWRAVGFWALWLGIAVRSTHRRHGAGGGPACCCLLAFWDPFLAVLAVSVLGLKKPRDVLPGPQPGWGRLAGGSGPHARVWQMFEMHAPWGLDPGLDLGAELRVGSGCTSRTRVTNFQIPGLRPHARARPRPRPGLEGDQGERAPCWSTTTHHHGLAPTYTTPCEG